MVRYYFRAMLWQRRPRMHRIRSRNPLALTQRDVEVLRCLGRYRYLRSTYLHAFAGGASKKRFIERLCDLFHHGLIARASQQWQFADARCQPLVYERETRADHSLLPGNGDHAPRTYLFSGAHRQFAHALTICECLASIELATLARHDLRFITWPEILARAPESTRASTTPFRLATRTGRLIPDAIFGIEYRSASTRSYRFFALEVDRGTMPITRTNGAQTSHGRKLAIYDELIRNQGHRQLLGIPNLFVLTATTSRERLANLITSAESYASAPWFLFKVVEEGTLRKPLPSLVWDTWKRAGLPALSIAESG